MALRGREIGMQPADDQTPELGADSAVGQFLLAGSGEIEVDGPRRANG